MSIDPRSDRPTFAQVADMLRDRIRSGELSPGQQLPSETTLIGETGLNRATVRRGLAVLETEGLTEARRGRGVFVRERAPVIAVRSTRFSRSARAAGKGALAAEAEALGLEWRSESLGETEIVTPNPEIAEALGEERAAVKRRLMWVGGEPTQLADSYVAASVDEQIGWSRGETAPGGIYGLLEQSGFEIARFIEELHARIATPEEAVALHLPTAASPVVALTRQAIGADGRVLEYFDSVAVADRHRYRYEFPATD